MQSTSFSPRLLSACAFLVGSFLGSAVRGAESPPNAFAPAPGRLALWSFNEPGLATADGRVPATTRGLKTVPSIDGVAPSFGRSNQVQLLAFPAVSPGGGTNLSYPLGAVRFLYRPNWSSRQLGSDPQYSWGRGPTRWAHFFEVTETAGGKTEPVLVLSMDPDGTNLVLKARAADGSLRTNFSTAIAWLKTQPELNPDLPWPWHEVAVSWSPTNTQVVVDGVHMQDWSTKQFSGPGVGRLAGAGSALSLTIGTDARGDGPVNGLMDEVETYDRFIGPLDLYHYRGLAVLNAVVAESPLAVNLKWFSTSAEPIPVRRRLLGSTNWVVLTNRWAGFSFVDRDPQLRLGETYEYEAGRRAAVVPLQARPVERRGHVLLLVDETVARPLANELDQLRSDLVGDGWSVQRQNVPRHDDNAWARDAINTKHIADLRKVKSHIQAAYAAAPGEPHAALLIGHVTVPYSGVAYEDGHWEMNGAWPADSFYGDMDGQWSDQVMNTGNNLPSPMRRNVAGDGKLDSAMFDQHIATPSGQHGVEVAIGRIDLARLPAFAPTAEVELLRRYLRKDHAYRVGTVRYGQDVCGGAFFWTPFSPVGRSIYLNALSTASRLQGLQGLVHGDAFQSTRPLLWALQGGYGGADTLHNDRSAAAAQRVRVITTAYLATNRAEAPVAFFMAKGSYFGDWNGFQNDFMRALLATPQHGLVSCWTMEKVWRFETLAAGDTLGSGLVRTARGDASTRTTFLLGDPTLRAFVTRPPVKPVGRERGNRVELTWESSPDADAGYLVYRSTKGMDGPFERVSGSPITSTSFSDADAPRNRKLYQIRACQRLTTGTGSFTNLSQAAFVTVD